MKSEFGLAIHALVYLERHPGALVSSETLAKNACTNPARIRKIMAVLRKNHFIDAKEGCDGGYFFAGHAASITLGDICRALQEKIVVPPQPTGDVDMDCLISSGMGAVLNSIYQELDALGIRYLDTITIQRIGDKIFNRSEEK